jgi:general secretion pathway protein D
MKLFLCSVALWFSCSVFAAPAPAGPQPLPNKFDFQSMPLKALVALYYKEVAKQPYVLCSDLLNDERLVSIRAEGKMLDVALMVGLLDEYGYAVRQDSGVSVVCKKPAAVEKPPVVVDTDSFVYQPKHRDVAYLVGFLSPLVRGTFANKRAPAPSLAIGGNKEGGGMAQALVSTAAPAAQAVNDDIIIFNGAPPEIERLQKLLAQVDTPSGSVMVNAYLYEVGKTAAEGSAVDMLMSVLGGKLGIEIKGDASGMGGSAVSIKTPSLDFVAKALSTDNRFRIVTSPRILARSGVPVRLQVGQDVPVIGAIVTTANGQSTQSFDRLPSGVIIDVLAKVRGVSTEVDLVQTISDFTQTSNAVTAPPILNKREIRTSLEMTDGEVVVIGGLTKSNQGDTRTGLSFLPWSLGKTNVEAQTELVLILEVKKRI